MLNQAAINIHEPKTVTEIILQIVIVFITTAVFGYAINTIVFIFQFFDNLIQNSNIIKKGYDIARDRPKE